MAKKQSQSLERGLTDLQEHVRFLESTNDLDAAIDRYKVAIASISEIKTLLDQKKQEIVVLKHTLNSVIGTVSDTNESI